MGNKNSTNTDQPSKLETQKQKGNKKGSGAIPLVGHVPFLQALDSKAARQIQQYSTACTFAKGQTIVEAGKSLNSFHVVVSGAVELRYSGSTEHSIVWSKRGMGGWFGDRALVGSHVYPLTAVAIEETQTMSFTKEQYDTLSKLFPAARASVSTVDPSKRIEPVNIVLKDIPFFSEVSDLNLLLLAEKTHYEVVPAKTFLCKQGQSDADLVIMVQGAAHISVKDLERNEEVHIGRIQSGDWYGELALMEQIDPVTTVVTSEQSAILRISRETFETFLKIAPEVRNEKFEQSIRTRHVEVLKSVPWFASLRTKQIGPLVVYDEGKLSVLSSLFRFVRVKQNERVLSEGDPAEKLFIILSGSVRVCARDSDETLATVGQYGCFGESAVLQHRTCSANVDALEPLQLLQLHKSDMDRFLTIAPEFKPRMESLVSMRTAERLRKVAFFSHVVENKPWSKLDLLGGLFQFEVFDKDAQVIHQGDRGNTFYIIATGEVSVTVQSESGESVTLATLSAGDSFGEMALLTICTRTASVRCLSPCTFVSITADKFERFLEIAPELRPHCEKSLTERTAAMLKTFNEFKAKHIVNPDSSQFLNQPKLDRVASLLSFARFDPQETPWIYETGKSLADTFYILFDGNVEMVKGEETQTIKAGHHFGAEGLLTAEGTVSAEPLPRTHSVRPLSVVHCLTLDRDGFCRFIAFKEATDESSTDAAISSAVDAVLKEAPQGAASHDSLARKRSSIARLVDGILQHTVEQQRIVLTE